MAEQRGAHLQRHAEILQPGRKRMPQIMKVEVLRAEDYWSFPLDGEEWTQGFPPALTVEDVTLLF
jgi:hypothetical protein